MDEYDKWDESYYEKFGDWFPNMCFIADSEEEHIQKMKDCIESGIPAKERYNLSYDQSVSY